MKRKLLFIDGILIIILSVLLILEGYYNRTNVNDNISIMYTNKYIKSTYSMYNTYNKSVENIFLYEK